MHNYFPGVMDLSCKKHPSLCQSRASSGIIIPDDAVDWKFLKKKFLNTVLRVSQGGGGPCSLVPFQNCPMFPCSHTLSECFRTVIFRNFVPCSQKLANVPLFPSIFCKCSLVPQNPWETLSTVRPQSKPVYSFFFFIY